LRVLLIRPGTKIKAWMYKGRSDYMPLGAAVVASYLAQHGVDVEILDNNTECLDRDALWAYLRRRSDDFDVYGISAMAPQYKYVNHLSFVLKDLTQKPIILGGPLATYSPELVLERSAVDFCVLGEGQETALDLLNNLETPERVPGICYRDSDGVPHRTPPRVYKQHLDDYPLPAYDLFDMRSYLKAPLYSNPISNVDPFGRFSTPFVYTGLGCPYRCRFCTAGLVKARLRSVENVIAEIEVLQKRYDIDGVRFADDLLISGKSRVKEFCRRIEGLGIVFSGQARANTMDDEVAAMLKKAGCVSYGIGIESGSDRILRLIDKHATREQNRRALLLGEKYDMAVKVQILFGFPGEDRASVEETLSLFRETGYPPRRFQKLTPLPGSAVYDDCVDLGIIRDEHQYLNLMSSRDAGFVFNRLLLNLTEWSDQEYMDTYAYAEGQIRSMIKKSEKRRFGPIDRLRRGAVKTAIRLNGLSGAVKEKGLSGLLSIRLSKQYRLDEIRSRYFDLSPLLSDEKADALNPDPDSWNGVTPEKISALIQRYSKEGADERGDTVHHNEWGETTEARYTYKQPSGPHG
jgi:anaerobic magnesium-protoporphyrin IX monomethyl ester cyclase